MSLLLGHDEAVSRFVGDRIGSYFQHDFVGVGLLSDAGVLTGGVIFHNWNGRNADLAGAFDAPINRRQIKGLRHYAFDQLGAARLTVRPATTNRAAIRFLRRRAILEAILPEFSPLGDAMQYVIYPHHPAWLRWKVEV